MTKAASDNPSQHEANKMVRVLNGQRLKYTIRLHFNDGRILEWQSERVPQVKWNDQARALWLYADGYSGDAIAAWPDGAMMFSEENPKAE